MNNAPTASAKYNVATLIDIARIPADRFPEMLKDLPRLIESIRPFVALVDELGEDQLKLIAESLVWVDDGIHDGSGDKMTVTYNPNPHA